MSTNTEQPRAEQLLDCIPAEGWRVYCVRNEHAAPSAADVWRYRPEAWDLDEGPYSDNYATRAAAIAACEREIDRDLEQECREAEMDRARDLAEDIEFWGSR